MKDQWIYKPEPAASYWVNRALMVQGNSYPSWTPTGISKITLPFSSEADSATHKVLPTSWEIWTKKVDWRQKSFYTRLLKQWNKNNTNYKGKKRNSISPIRILLEDLGNNNLVIIGICAMYNKGLPIMRSIKKWIPDKMGKMRAYRPSTDRIFWGCHLKITSKRVTCKIIKSHYILRGAEEN